MGATHRQVPSANSINLPCWTIIFLCNVAACSESDATSLMRYDVTHHPDDARAIVAGDMALRFDTLSVQRGSILADANLIEINITSNETMHFEHADYTEIWQPQLGGAEQSWIFDKAPAGVGALIITVDATGLEYVNTTSSGLVLKSDSKFQVQYGHGTWLDATSTRIEIPARFESSKIILTVPSEIVAGSSFPAALDPGIMVTPG